MDAFMDEYITKKFRSLRKPQYLLISEMQNFYVLDFLAATVGEDQLFLSRGRLKKDLIETKSAHEKMFAAAIFDYLCLALCGEARWARMKCARHIATLTNAGSRESTQQQSMRYDPSIFLPKIATLFDQRWHSGSYGGKSWMKIAEAAMMYGNVPDTVFIDHCVDLKHNGGLAFDKCVIWSLFYKGFSHDMFLSRKSKLDIVKWGTLTLDIRVKGLLERAKSLGFIDDFPPVTLITNTYQNNYDEQIYFLSLLETPYEAVVWGGGDVGDLEVSDYEEDDYEDDDYEEDDDEDDDDYKVEEKSHSVTFTDGDARPANEGGVQPTVNLGALKLATEGLEKVAASTKSSKDVFDNYAKAFAGKDLVYPEEDVL